MRIYGIKARLDNGSWIDIMTARNKWSKPGHKEFWVSCSDGFDFFTDRHERDKAVSRLRTQLKNENDSLFAEIVSIKKITREIDEDEL